MKSCHKGIIDVGVGLGCSVGHYPPRKTPPRLPSTRSFAAPPPPPPLLGLLQSNVAAVVIRITVVAGAAASV